MRARCLNWHPPRRRIGSAAELATRRNWPHVWPLASARGPVITPQRLKEISEYVLREGAAGEVRGVLNIGRYLVSQLFRASEEGWSVKVLTQEVARLKLRIRCRPKMPSAPATPQPLEIATPLLCQELWGGGFLVAPVANSELACRGDSLAACLAEQRLFLEEYLASAEPATVARFAVPSSAKLVDLEIDAPRADLPKRLAVPGPVSLTCISVAFKEESWAFLPTLGHAVRVENKSDFAETVRAEAERLVAALELSPAQWLRLLPPRSQTLEWMTLKLRRPDLDTVEKARAARKKAVKEKRTAEAAEILASVAVALHNRPEAKSAPRLVGRDRELAELSARDASARSRSNQGSHHE